MAARILTLTTDFGADGPYLAAMKGVVLGLAPGTQIVDISHAIAAQDILEGGFVLSAVVDYFPRGTVHLAVIDPGVGTNRRIIAVEVGDHWFVLPDNGLISEVLRGREPSRIHQVSDSWVRNRRVSATFHGRDIMAPAAAHLLNGGDPGELGPALTDLILIPTPEPTATEVGLAGTVIFVDRFGNLITNISRELLGSVPLTDWEIEILSQTIDGISPTYGHQSPGTLVGLVGSSERVEVAIVNGDASKLLQAGRGTPVIVRPKQGASRLEPDPT